MNMLTAAGVAHVNRLPVLLLPGDVFASRRPDPVLQQVEDWGDGTAQCQRLLPPGVALLGPDHPAGAVADGAAPVRSRHLTDPAELRPGDAQPVPGCSGRSVRLSRRLVRAMPASPAPPRTRRGRVGGRRRTVLRRASKPLIVAGGGVLYSEATQTLQDFATRHGIPVAETQAGKGALPWDHPLAVGSIGVTGSSAANALAREADAILAVGTRLQDFTTGSRLLLPGGKRLIQLNIQPFDAGKHGAMPLVGDARRSIAGADGKALGDHASPPAWRARASALMAEWNTAVETATASGMTPRCRVMRR